MPSKEAVAKAILTRTPLRIHLDPRRDGVVVPARFRNDARLILEVGEKMRVHIPDLVVDALGVKGHLALLWRALSLYCALAGRLRPPGFPGAREGLA